MTATITAYLVSLRVDDQGEEDRRRDRERQQQGKHRLDDDLEDHVRRSRRDERKRPEQLPVEALVPAQLLLQVAADRLGRVGDRRRPRDEDRVVAGGEHQVRQVAVVAVRAEHTAESLANVVVPDDRKHRSSVRGERAEQQSTVRNQLWAARSWLNAIQ